MFCFMETEDNEYLVVKLLFHAVVMSKIIEVYFVSGLQVRHFHTFSPNLFEMCTTMSFVANYF